MTPTPREYQRKERPDPLVWSLYAFAWICAAAVVGMVAFAVWAVVHR